MSGKYAMQPEFDPRAVCIFCGTRGLIRTGPRTLACPTCGASLEEHGEEEHPLWADEQARGWALVKRRRGNKKAGRKIRKVPRRWLDGGEHGALQG